MNKAIALGKAALTTLMASEAAGMATHDVLQRGGSTAQAFWTGTLVGGVEAATELIDIGLLDDAFKAVAKGANATRVASNIVRQCIGDGSEEVVAELGGNLVDGIVNKSNSNFNRYVDELVASGMSRAQAYNQAQLKFLGKDLVLAYAGGAISGMAMGSGVSTAGYFSTRSKIDTMTANTMGLEKTAYNNLPKETKQMFRNQFKEFVARASGDVVEEKIRITTGKHMEAGNITKAISINTILANGINKEIAMAEARLSELNEIEKPTKKQKQEIANLIEQIESDRIYLETVNGNIAKMKTQAAQMTNKSNKAAVQQGQAQDTANDGGVVPYSDERIKRIQRDMPTYTNLVEGVDITLGEFYEKTLNEQGSAKYVKLYLGELSPSMADNINKMKSDQNVSGYDFIITNKDIRHINKEHGVDGKKAKSDYAPVSKETIELFKDVLNNPDDIANTHDTDTNEPAILFGKRINGYLVLVEAISDGRSVLHPTSMYIKKNKPTAMYDAKTPVLYAQDGRSLTSTNSIRSSNNKINSTKRIASQQSNQAKDTARTERQSVHKPQPAEFKIGGAKANIQGIASVQSGKVTVELENGDLAIADDLKFENKTQGQLLDKAKHFETNAAKTFTAVHEANIPVNDYYLGFTAIYGAARTGTAFEQALQINEYTAALPSHIQQAAYNAGVKAGVIADDVSMKNATSVRVKTEQLRFNKWLKEHNTEVIAKKQEISERFKEAESNGDVAEMNKQRKEYQALNQWSGKTIRDKKAQIGKAVGGVVKSGGEKVADKTGIGANATDISANATDIGANATDIGKTANRVQALPSIATNAPNDVKEDGNDVNAAVGAVLKQINETNASVEDAMSIVTAIAKGSSKTWTEFYKAMGSKFSSVAEASSSYIKLIEEQSPWPKGFDILAHKTTLESGAEFRMVLDSTQDLDSPGGFATFDEIPNIAYARNQLAIKSNWKLDCGQVVTYRVKEGVSLPVIEGPVGPQIDIDANRYLSGGATQIQFDLLQGVNRMDYFEVVSVDTLN